MGSLLFTEPMVEEPAVMETQEVNTINFEPKGFEGFFHAAIKDGTGVFIDGEQRNRDKLIESVESVLDQLSTNPNGQIKAARGQFLTDVCRIFKLPTTIGTGDVLDQTSVIDDLKQIPEEIISKSDGVITRTTKPFEPLEDISSHSKIVDKISSEEDSEDETEEVD